MANSPALEAQYGAIIDGIAMLSDMQPVQSSHHTIRVTSANRGPSQRAPSRADPYQRVHSLRPSSKGAAAVSIGLTSPTDNAVNDDPSRQGSALQPSFSSNTPGKLQRPVSRDRITSAWGTPQHSALSRHEHGQITSSSPVAASAYSQASFSGRAGSGQRAHARPLSRQVTAPQVTRADLTSFKAPSLVCSAKSFRPSSAQRQASAMTAMLPASRQQHHVPSSSSAAEPGHRGSHAMGMTLSQYMSQMPSRQAAAGESWARPVSASLTAEDCQPSDRAHLVEDLSSIEDDESPGWRDDDPWDAAGGLGREAPSPPGPDDTEEPSASSRHLRSARGNGLDLRPATAASVFGSQTLSSTSQDANSTRQTDLGSLSAQLFAPRPQSQQGFRPPSRRLSRPSSAQRVAIRQSGASGETPHAPSVSKQQDAAHQQAPGLVVRGGRKVQSARPSERDQRPPSRQKPPPEALHLFQPMHGSSSGGFAPSPVFRAAPAGTTRPSTSAAIMLQTAAPRFKPSAVLHTGRMTLEDLQKLSDAAVDNSQAIAAGGNPGDRVPIRPYRPPSARPTSARPPSAR